MRVDDVFPEHPPGRYHVTVAEDGRQTWVRLRERGRPKEEGSHVLDELFLAHLQHAVDTKRRESGTRRLGVKRVVAWLAKSNPAYAGKNVESLCRRLRERRKRGPWLEPDDESWALDAFDLTKPVGP